MVHGAQTGGTQTYNYDAEYARLAADAFGEIISLVEAGSTQYELAKFDYENVYDHKKSAGVETSYSELFFTAGRGWLQPGGKEALLRGPPQDGRSPATTSPVRSAPTSFARRTTTSISRLPTT